jgi:hypothetical protein
MLHFLVYSTPSGGQATTDVFADTKFVEDVAGGVDAVIRAITSGPLSFHFQNTGANSITYQILGSNDLSFADAKWIVVVNPTALGAGNAVAEFVDTGRFIFYKVQIKATGAGSQGTLVAAVAAKRF